MNLCTFETQNFLFFTWIQILFFFYLKGKEKQGHKAKLLNRKEKKNLIKVFCFVKEEINLFPSECPNFV